ncbi:lysine--tRNA ligase [Candidatus Campbellbacteria bacterium CG10_big_fil_rev_8_21_14_0_10_35_52]|uniref:Lysine--tRNA ligase n=1 Tax=Candidatus Campbellbacteria bacterium CG10_big_fil_rev_8_21_14_0_10_35_52 TaxID=1974527 RepID=A0A2M6WW06_9BACT|nr:MAG: lysine--tRNA ligase [Candidatus Campbellbacteria bacterium CG10_big_fil_rev_8_21_14_0_10_35_52]
MENNTDKFREDSIAKLEILKKAGVNPYPSKSKRNKKIAVFLDDFNKGNNATLAGRIRSIRSHGKIGFADIEDESGKIQIFFQSENLDNFKLLSETLDIGDIIEITGKPYLTKAGQQSIRAENIKVLSKSIAPWPVEHFGIKDKEERFRKRYLDISLNSEVKKHFIQKTKIIKAIRNYLEKNDFMEVSTPVLQTIAGGTMAKPFKTHLDTLDIDLYLRIAPELYLKRLLIGGFEKIYEIGPIFRNEGIDREHNPEFTMMELYYTYQDWEELIDFTENMLKNVSEIVGKPLPKDKWRNIEFDKLIKEKTGLDYDKNSKEEFLNFAKKNNIDTTIYHSKGKIADEIFKKIIRIDIKEPTFVTKIPIDISPLSKQLEDEPEKTARFLLIINGMELVNGFSELNDPIEQAKRFESQMEMKKKGDKETQEYDKDFIEALEYGMPPTAGLGLGIDRFVMLLTGVSNLREIIEFPLMKRK